MNSTHETRRIPNVARFVISFFLAFNCLAAVSFAQTPSNADLLKTQELFNAGNVFFAKGDAQSAVQKYSEAITISPSVALPYLNRGVAYLTLSKYSEAMSDADKALSLLATGTFPGSYSAIAYQIKGSVLQNQGDLKAALEYFSKSIELEPSDPRFWNSRGNAFRLLGQLEAALKDFDKAIELNGTVPMFFTNRGTVYLKMKDLASSTKNYDEAIRLEKSSDMAYFNRGNAYLEFQKYDEALTDYNQAISLKPRSEYYYGRGRLYLLIGKYQLAIKDNTDSISMNSKYPNAFLNRAIAYSRINQDAAAIADMRAAVNLTPNSPAIRYNLAFLLLKTGKFSDAAAEATKTIELAPQWKSPYQLRASVYAKLGNPAKAKADRDAAAKLTAGDRPVEDSTFVVFELIQP